MGKGWRESRHTCSKIALARGRRSDCRPGATTLSVLPGFRDARVVVRERQPSRCSWRGVGAWQVFACSATNDDNLLAHGVSLCCRARGVRIVVRKRQLSRCPRRVAELARGRRLHLRPRTTTLSVFPGCRDAGTWEAFARSSARAKTLSLAATCRDVGAWEALAFSSANDNPRCPRARGRRSRSHFRERQPPPAILGVP